MEKLSDRIKQMLEKRDEIFRTHSNNIFEEIPHVLEGIDDFLKQQKDPGRLSWHDITYSVVHENVPAILLVGEVSYDIGQKITLPSGEEITVNKSVADYFRRDVRINIPMHIVDRNDATHILAFLENMLEREKHEQAVYEAALAKIAGIDSDDVEQEHPLDEFNTTDLTEEQQKALEMFKNFDGGKTN